MDVYSSENEVSLRQGDILLFHGHGFVSWAIVLRPETMAEATASGLRHVAIEPAVDGNAFTSVRRLATGVAPPSVVERALTFSCGSATRCFASRPVRMTRSWQTRRAGGRASGRSRT